MIIYLSLLVSIIGALCYLLAKHPKIQDMGRICFIVGIAVFLLQYPAHSVGIIPR